MPTNTVEQTLKTSANAWLALAVEDNRQYAGNEGYADLPSERYVWDNTVPNHKLLKTGDIIVLWDKRCLLGLSVVEDISEKRASKARLRCPSCGKTGFKERRFSPRFRCPNKLCRHEFDEAVIEQHEVTRYTSHHGRAWVDLAGLIGGEELRGLCFKPKTQHSLRQLDWDRFSGAIAKVSATPVTAFVQRRQAAILGGHVERIVRARRGQASFRKSLLEEFGSVCAFTGPCPERALEAAHLYSYAEHGTHVDGGGVLLRRDIHTLFDNGLLTISDYGIAIRVHPALKEFPEYARLENQPPKVRLRKKTKAILSDHFELHAHEYASLT